jgi:hypothetical protein
MSDGGFETTVLHLADAICHDVRICLITHHQLSDIDPERQRTPMTECGG